VVKPKGGPSNGKLFTEEDWNNESSLTEGPYYFSKVQCEHPSCPDGGDACMATCMLNRAACMLQAEAEKAAWELAKAEGFDLVTILPTFVLGPVIGDRADATSILSFKVRTLPASALKLL
jgi:hypothetical protein